MILEKMNPIYLDYNASTPLIPEVVSAMRPYLEEMYGNPSSSHAFGIQGRKAVEKARAQLADLLNCAPDELIFTSGGTESNNLAIKGVAFARRSKGNHIITSAVEHPAVLEVCRYLEGMGYQITYLPVDKYGRVDPGTVEDAITPETILITIMHSNNEVGTIQPVSQIASIARAHGVLFHTDAAQSVGKVPVDVRDSGVDLLSVAGHKFYAPKGIGALYIRRGVRLEKLIHGADHEQNQRAGTENVLEIVGLGKAAGMAGINLEQFQKRIKALKEKFLGLLKMEMPDIMINGHPDACLPNTLSVSFPGIDASTLLSMIPEIAASPGAACHSGHVTTSSVLSAMNIPGLYAMGTVRFSLGIMTTEEEIDQAAKIITGSVRKFSASNADAQSQNSKPEETIRLTEFTHALGCACKVNPRLLERLSPDCRRSHIPMCL